MNAQDRDVTTSSHNQSAASATAPSKKKRAALYERVRYLLVRTFLPFKTYVPPNGVTPEEAVTSFLRSMSANAARTSPAWIKMLTAALEDAGYSYDRRRAFFERSPVEDLYFAGSVALEASRIRALYAPADANALLAEIGAQVDGFAKRGDRIMSALVFELIGRIRISQGPVQQKMPYDIVTKIILQQLDSGDDDVIYNLIADKAFRHALGEPLALGIRNWWSAFHDQFVIYLPPETEEPAEDESEALAPAASAPAKRPWRPKRAAMF